MLFLIYFYYYVSLSLSYFEITSVERFHSCFMIWCLNAIVCYKKKKKIGKDPFSESSSCSYVVTFTNIYINERVIYLLEKTRIWLDDKVASCIKNIHGKSFESGFSRGENNIYLKIYISLSNHKRFKFALDEEWQG